MRIKEVYIVSLPFSDILRRTNEEENLVVCRVIGLDAWVWTSLDKYPGGTERGHV